MSAATTSNEAPQLFPATQWTVVLAAGATRSPEAMAALGRLCGSYWYPLYAFVRRNGYSPADAQDLTQEFFARLVEHNWVAHAVREKGRFRSFLLIALKRFLVKEWEKSRALKRGGQVQFVRFPLDSAESRYSREPADPRTPEQAFEAHWALALLEKVLNRLREEYGREGKAKLFEVLEPCLVGESDTQPYATLCPQLGVSEAATKMATSRLRQRYREFLREEIAQTVASPSEVDEEVRHLFRVLARK